MQTAEATVVATFSRRMLIRLADGAEQTARIKGKTLRPVCGDRVSARSIANESDWQITAILPRRNALSRPNLRGRTELLAANVDLLVVVAAASPAADWFIVDRYLCAAEQMSAAALVVFNKIDEAPPDDAFGEYAAAGYETLACSARNSDNIESLRAALGTQTAILVGQSGVGKSSLLNSLLGNEALLTAAVSEKSREGRHTTVNSRMLEVPGGARVIDSPGVRDYAPAIDDVATVAHGFREIDGRAQDCRFANCRHLREPGCAVKAAVEAGSIAPRRYESYRRLLALTDKLANQRNSAS